MSDERTQAMPPNTVLPGTQGSSQTVMGGRTVMTGQTGQPGQTVIGEATQMLDPNRTQMAPPPQFGAPVYQGANGPALTLTAKPGASVAYAPEPTRTHVLTQIAVGSGVGGGVASGGRRLPVNVSLVIDRSGSMEGEPLEYVKRACSFVVDMLSPDDVLSIVTFEETVEVVMPARRVTDPNLIKQHIARITPGNTTNLFDGLYAGGSQVASVAQPGYVSRVLLLTDGEPTAGLRDFQSIVQQVGDLKARGVTVTALGFGPEYNEELMAGIARKSGGNYYYIARPDEIPGVFQKEMEQVLGVTARDVQLTLELPRGVNVRQCYGSPIRYVSGRSATISLGDLERGATLTKLWEMDVDSRQGGTYRVAKAALSYTDGATGQTQTQSANVVMRFGMDINEARSSPDPDVARELSVVMAGRDLERTMMGMKTQQLSVADLTQALDRTQAILTQQGRTSEAHEVAQAAQAARSGNESAMEKTLIGAIYHLDQGRKR